MSLINSTAIPSGATGYEIDNSLRFNDDDSATLTRTPPSASDTKLWTFSTWFKLGNIKQQSIIMCPLGSGYSRIEFDGGSFAFLQYNGSSYDFNITETAKRRDTSAWYHIMVVYDSAQGTDTNRIKLYVNGSQVTVFSSPAYPSQNLVTPINSNVLHTIGWTTVYGATHYMDGYLAETHFIDGAALTPTSFGETGTYGEWKPILVTDTSGASYTSDLTYGTNGFYLPFDSTSALGADRSPNDSNHWTVNNITASDQMVDSPTNNFATLNPLHHDSEHSGGVQNHTFSEGNLKISTNTMGSQASNFFGTIGVSSGKWYWEAIRTGGNVAGAFGFATYDVVSRMAYYGNGNKYDAAGSSSYGASWTTGDIIGIALDADTQSLTFYKNGVSQGTISNALSSNDTYFPFGWDGSGSLYSIFVTNFGQDSSFAGNKTAQGNQDGNSIGDFYYTPPTGFLALCTQNLPEPTVVPSEHFNTITYTGTDADDRAITGVGFQPDFAWFKRRNTTTNHGLFDVLRGANKRLSTNLTDAEFSDSNALMSFDSDGYTVSSDGTTNAGGTYVAWNWKANGSGSSGSSSTGGLAVVNSANVDAGFSIISWTGNMGVDTFSHGLSKAPEFLIVKNRDNAGTNWIAWHKDFATNYNISLNSTNPSGENGQYFFGDDTNMTVPDSTYITIGNNNQVNATSKKIICYAWHSVDGYSKVGSYTGNGNADGPFVYTGFRPAYVMVKSSSMSNSETNWVIWDNERNGYNDNVQVFANQSWAEGQRDDNGGAGIAELDILSNGFKHRDATWAQNGQSGATFIYIAFAETPFKYSNAR